MSNFVVSARKYRPTRFDEVVGQQHVSQTLKNALQNNQLAHAFLFCGPRGVGKTTCARILAKVLNCENLTPDHEACNVCSSCTSFNENASFNITELDAASNNSVEHIRALIEQVRFQPQQGQYKVFIIDEVHMLSQQAFNAFLKTLEEPPPYAIFILATTEKHKIIPTILSRCQIFDFRRIQVNDIVAHLQEICEKESIVADKDALHIIGQKADGALRDALSIFDRIVSSLPATDRRISYEHVIQNLNVLDYDYYFRVVDAMLSEDVGEVMMIFDDVLKKGFEADIFLLGLAEHFRNLLVCKDEATLPLLQASEGLRDRYRAQALQSPEHLLLTALSLANDCDVNYKMARNKRLHVEMCLIRATYSQRRQELSNLVVAAPATPEKKTPDVSSPAPQSEAQKVSEPPITQPKEELVPANQPSEVPSSSMPVEPTVATNPPPVEMTPPAAEPEKKPAPVEASTAAPLREAINTASLAKTHSTPTIMSLETIEAELEAEEEAEVPQEETPLTRENVEAAWQNYSSTRVTSPSLKATFVKAELEVMPDKFRVLVGSTVAKEMIQQEAPLMPFLRKALSRPKLIMEVEVDKSKLPTEPVNKPKKALTVKEKYDMMRQVNPLIEDLRQRFGLKPDYD